MKELIRQAKLHVATQRGAAGTKQEREAWSFLADLLEATEVAEVREETARVIAKGRVLQ